MEFIFLNAAGSTLFTRSDAETAHWIQHELNLTAEFPYNRNKVINRGQRIAFRDLYSNSLHVFEVRQVVNSEPAHYQRVTAEHIAVAELSDEHINTAEITNKTASQALTSVLTGTGWRVGTNTASGTQNANISRGNVWQAISTIKQNWNVYITPRIAFSAAGTIQNKFLDIAPAEGVWNGVRLSIHKNMTDPTVTYNDEDVLTALYGYGGTVNKTNSGSDDSTEELTFKDVVWTATANHPAKPSGQTYLEYPAKTALYGRNGRARFGYYQNANVTDATTLLNLTWEALKKTCDPKISISGTCTELKRLGYNDEPMKLHDLAIVEIAETGELFQKEIICLDVDLIDPSNTRVEIGDYIPNIVYINRDTNDKASGGGGGGGRGQTNAEAEESDTFALFEKTNDKIGMVVGTRNGGYYVKAGEIALSINQSGGAGSYETTATISADHVNISGTSSVYTLAGALHTDADGKLIIDNAGGVFVQRTQSGTTATFGVWDKGNLTGGVMVTQINGQSSLTLSADVIDVNGLVSKLAALSVRVNILNVTTTASFGGLASFNSIGVGGRAATWVTKTILGTTIHYLGYE